MSNIAQHSVNRTHQVAVLAYKKGVRDALKHFASMYAPDSHVSSNEPPHTTFQYLSNAYALLVHDCSERENVLSSQPIIDSPTPGSIRSSNAPTPTTVRNLERMGSDLHGGRVTRSMATSRGSA